MRRISIAGSLGFVAVIATGFASLVNATNVWAGIAFTLTIGELLASVLAVIVRGWRQGGWLGFALFGWGYFLLGNLAFLHLDSPSCLLPDAAAEWVFFQSNPQPVKPASLSTYVFGTTPTPEISAYMYASRDHDERFSNAKDIGRWLSVLGFAQVGAILEVLLARERRMDEPAPSPT